MTESVLDRTADPFSVLEALHPQNLIVETAQHLARSSGAHPRHAWNVALSIAAANVPDTTDNRPYTLWPEAPVPKTWRPTWWAMICAPSGSRKSAMVEEVRPLIGRGVHNTPESWEGLVELYVEEPHAVIIDTDMGKLLATSANPRHYSSAVLQGLVKLAENSRHALARRLKGQIIRPEVDPQAVVIGAVTPGQLGALGRRLSTQWEDGLFARFAWSHGSATNGLGSLEDPYRQRVQTRRSLGARWEAMRAASWLDGERRVPIPLYAPAGMEAEALKLDAEYRAQYSKIMADTLSDKRRTLITRAPDIALRAALLVAWTRGEARSPHWRVSREAMEVGWLCFEAHYQDALLVMRQTSDDDGAMHRAWILRVLRDGDSKSLPDMLRILFLDGLHLSLRDAQAAVDDLVMMGIIRAKRGQITPDGSAQEAVYCIEHR